MAATAGVEQEGIPARIRSEAFSINEMISTLVTQVTRDENPVMPSQRLSRAQRLEVTCPEATFM